MTAVGLGQQRSEAVGSGFKPLPYQNFLRYIFLFPIPEISETLKGSPIKIFGTITQKFFDGKS